MSTPRCFVFDANAFIEAKRRYYAFDVCPGYWSALLAYHAQGRIGSIDRVGAELLKGNDELKTWAATAPSTFFADSSASEVLAWYSQMQAWVQGQSQFFQQAKADFAAKADAWVIAYAKARGLILVTHEEYNAEARKRVPIPNVCRAFGVEHTDVFAVMRELGVKFTWQLPQ